MATRVEVNRFIKNQRSIRWYKSVQNAFRDVLLAMPDKDYKIATKNLVLMVLHRKALGQLMYLSKINGKFKILQMSIAKKDAPMDVLRYVVAHELGHAMQKRNWKKTDGSKLEDTADEWAKKWGFPKTKKIKTWMKKRK